MKKIISAFLFSFFLTIAFSAGAQTPGAETPPSLNFAQISKELDAASAKLNSGTAKKGQISEILQTLTQMQGNLSQARQYYVSEQDSAQKKLNTLGEAPEKPNSEPASIASQRREFTSLADKAKIQITQIDLLTTKIDDVNNLILKIRNRQLLNNILVKQSSIFHPQEFGKSLADFAVFVFELIKSPIIWYKNLPLDRQAVVNSNILLVVVSMLGALIAAYLLRRYIKRELGYRRSVEYPDYSQKVRAGIWMFVARGVIPAAIIGAFLLWLKNTPVVYADSFGLLLEKVAIYLLYYYLSKAVVKVVFIPYSSKWRIIEVADERARSVSSALIFSAAAICSVSFFQDLADKMNYNTSIVYSLKIMANAVKAFCIIWVTRRALYDSKSLSDEEISEDAPVADLTTSSKVSMAIAFAMSVAFVLSLFGYIRLSEYIIDRFIVSALIVGVFYISNKFIFGMFHQLLLLRFWVRTFRINRRTLVKTEFWFGLFLTPVIWIVAFFVLLAVWGVSVDLLLVRIKNFLVGFNVGGVHISITSILLGVFSFFIMLSLFKMLKNSFMNGRLSNIEMSDGIRNSVVSSINFLGFIISGLLAIAVMGGSLGSITIIAGALSFGVGLGLQNMVSNLAAGMTILWERPIKIGDLVNINGQEGTVKQINMRSTEIEAGDKSTIIVPNSDILSKSLTNYTYSGRTGRISVKVGVDYNSDIVLVRNTLLEIASSNPDVLANPAPAVALINFGDNSIDFQLSCSIGNVFIRSGVADDVREKIITRFRELNINIPYPQRTVYLEQNKENKT